MPFKHQPVLLREVIDGLNPKPGQTFIDCTAGLGGHILELAKKIGPRGRILAIDLDSEAIKMAKKKTKQYSKIIVFEKQNYKNLKQIANVFKFNTVNGILLDLGLSNYQLQDQERGFSFTAEGPLDMRFGGESSLTAADIINTYDLNQLIHIFSSYGEEPLAKAISKKIIEIRQNQPIARAKELSEIINQIYQKKYHHRSIVNPATRVFQALRIEVNDELRNIKDTLPQAVSLLKNGGRLAVISFHSLEDRIVKEYFRQESKDCICPFTMPVCQCQHRAALKIITKKPIVAKAEELAVNPKARSAKLRIAEKI